MDVEHRRDRHVHVVPVQAPLGLRRAQSRHRRQRMQHELAVAEEHPLGQPGRAGSVKGGRAGVLVEILEAETRVRLRQQRFVLARAIRLLRRRRLVRQPYDHLHASQPGTNFIEHRRKFVVYQQHARAGVVERIGDLFRRQAHVYRHQHRRHHRYREIALQVAMTVPVHHRHRIAGLDAEPRERARKPPDALAELAIAVSRQVAIDDLLLRIDRERRVQQLPDEQGVAVGRGRRLDQPAAVIGCHGLLPFLVRFTGRHEQALPACRAAYLATWGRNRVWNHALKARSPAGKANAPPTHRNGSAPRRDLTTTREPATPGSEPHPRRTCPPPNQHRPDRIDSQPPDQGRGFSAHSTSKAIPSNAVWTTRSGWQR